MSKIKKIKITEIDPEIYTQKGLFGTGCYGSNCDDICCEYGCDVDGASYKLILKHAKLIEPLIKAKIEDCFSTELEEDDDYIGGSWRETAVRESDNRCAFHLIGSQGCSLFYLWATKGITKGITKRLIPTICRTYPITWHRGRLFVDRPLRWACKCREKVPKELKPAPSIYETQKKEIHALFDIQEKKRSKQKGAAKKSAARKAAPDKKRLNSTPLS